MSLPEEASALARRCAQILPEIAECSSEVIELLATAQRESSAASGFFAELLARHSRMIGAIRRQSEAMPQLYALAKEIDFARELRAFQQALQTFDQSLLDSEEKIRINSYRRDVVLQVPLRVGERVAAAQIATFTLAFTHHRVMATFLNKHSGTDRYLAEMQRVGTLLATATAGTLVPILEPVQKLVEVFTSEFDRNMKALIAATTEFDRIFALRAGFDTLIELCAQTDFVIERAQSAVRADLEEFRSYLALLRHDLGMV